MSEIAALFRKEAEDLVPYIKRKAWDFVLDCSEVHRLEGLKAHYIAVAEAVERGER